MPSVLDEERQTLTEAARHLKVHVSTIHRWRTKGVRGVRLSCLRIGNVVYVTKPNLEAFVRRLSDPPTKSETADAYEKRAADADAACVALGL